MNRTLLDEVRPIQGTDSRRDFSTGNTLPLIGVPRGLTYWTPQTSDGRWAFDARDAKLAGFRATHQPSPWMGDYGHFDVMPVVGDVGPTPASRASSYRLRTCRPDRVELDLLRYGVGARLTASRACGVFEFTFPPDAGDRGAIVVQLGAAEGFEGGEVRVERRGERTRLVGRSSANHGGVADGFGCHFVVDVSGAEVLDAAPLANAPRAGAIICLRPRGPVTVRVGTSFIDREQSDLNLAQEVGDRSFDAVADATAARWAEWLGRVQADGGTAADRVCLYSAMYRVGLFPMAMHEFDGAGHARHWSPYTGRVHAGRLYVNNGFWDTYRTVYPLLAQIDPAGLGEILDGLLQAYRQAGWLPRWTSPGYRDCMIGSHSDAIFADAIARGIGGFDPREAYEAIRRNAFDVPDRPGMYGRAAMADHLRLGYVPAEAAPYSVSWTLDNAHCDGCIAQVARKLGRAEDERVLTARTQNYRHLWHAGSRFMRPRRADGSWVEPWREFEWGHAYVEGGPWQHSLHVPHDLPGLADLHGGRDALVARVEQMLATPPRFEVGHYADEIHEMTEMAAAVDADGTSFGQYAHSNQPVHAFLWIPAALSVPDVTARYVRRVMRSLFTPERLPGDEDNGEMSAWYVLAAMNRFPACPGSGELVAAPVDVFEQIRVNA